MFSTPYFTSCMQSQSQTDQELQSHNNHLRFVSSLPSHLGWGIPLRRYLGFWFPEPLLPGVLSLRLNLPPSSSSSTTFLVTYPKSGTTWLKALAFAIATRSPAALLSRHPQDCSPFLEGLFSTSIVPNLDVLPSPRVLGTHCPYSVLPDSVKGHGRIVYLCREPKDTFVSTWHFASAMRPEGVEPLAMEEVFELFCEGVMAYGPVWDHMLEYWRESLRQPERVLFLRYEEMMERPEESVRRLAEFMGQPFTVEEEEHGAVTEVVRMCSFENLKGLEVNKAGVRGMEIDW